MNEIATGVNRREAETPATLEQYVARDAQQRALGRYVNNSVAERTDEECEDLSGRVLQLLDRLRDGLQGAVVEQAGEQWYVPYRGVEMDDFLTATTGQFILHLAENPQTSPEILEQLAMHYDPEVRMAVADNQSTSVDTLHVLAKDDDADVRYALAENHNIDLEILTILAEDQNPYVADRAQRTMQRIESGKVLTARFEADVRIERIRAIH